MQRIQKTVDTVGQREAGNFQEVLDIRGEQREEDGDPGVTGRLLTVGSSGDAELVEGVTNKAFISVGESSSSVMIHWDEGAARTG